MKKTIPALLLTACAALSSTNSWSRPLKAAHRELNVQSSIALSDNVDDPPVINELRSISLDFSAPLKLKSVAGNIKLYRVQLNGDKEQLTQEPTLCTLDKKNPSHITLSRKSGAGLREGEEYKITISEKVNSVEGASLGTAVTGYFALNHHFNLGQKGVPSLHNEREQIVCISDIHLGIDSKYAECQNNRSALINFLNQLSM